MNNLKNYDQVASIYPYLMRAVRYDKWADYLYKIVKSYVSEKDLVLELSAGNGRLADYFKVFFPCIIISDISLSMLCRSSSVGLPKVCCDMTAIPFKRKFNLIYSAFDSVNYLTSKKKLLSLFKEIKAVLKVGGVFTFDVTLEPNSLKHMKEPFRTGNYNGVRFTQTSRYDPKSRIHKNFFRINNNDQIFIETHRQKIYPFNEYFRLLDKAGLQVLECFDSFSFKDGNAGCERVQFLVRT
ncbi:MAG TPA: class I SAM-dependent methyltransferase [Ignavibacteriaceae bacterium]|nr:class I SAM-dependent methyltransferase [Ignavibacteriaceae bacterium]